MLRNLKGTLMWCMIPAYMVWASGAMVVAAIALTPSHRERKAVEICEASGSMTHDDCVSHVKSWDKSTLLAYIKDDAPDGNGGNFPGGNSNP